MGPVTGLLDNKDGRKRHLALNKTSAFLCLTKPTLV
jgi:hypothetical protein